MFIELKAGMNDNGRRLDRILRKALPDHSLSLIHRLLRQRKVQVNGKPVNIPGKQIMQGDLIKIQVQKDITGGKKQEKTTPAPLPEILWQGLGIIIFNKPSGLSTHGPGSLDNLVQIHFASKLSPSLSFKPGPLHRLDKLTSGAIAFSETLEGAKLFSLLLKEHKLEKTYLAIIEGHISKNEIWQDDLTRNKKEQKTYVMSDDNSKSALTIVKPIAYNSLCTLVEARIKTGRTHQIRAQAAAHGHPLAGDSKYGGHPISGAEYGFFLHAWKIELCESIEGFPGLIEAPLPERFLANVSGFSPFSQIPG